MCDFYQLYLDAFCGKQRSAVCPSVLVTFCDVASPAARSVVEFFMKFSEVFTSDCRATVSLMEVASVTVILCRTVQMGLQQCCTRFSNDLGLNSWGFPTYLLWDHACGMVQWNVQLLSDASECLAPFSYISLLLRHNLSQKSTKQRYRVTAPSMVLANARLYSGTSTNFCSYI